MTGTVSGRHAWAWLFLVGALAIHVTDESLTGFLDFYNPLVLSIRTRFAWFPMPTFTFGVWLAGLIVLVIILAMLTPAVARGVQGIVFASWALTGIMFLNGLGHLAGSAYYQRWLPGSTSAPVLIAASTFLGWTTWNRNRGLTAR